MVRLQAAKRRFRIAAVQAEKCYGAASAICCAVCFMDFPDPLRYHLPPPYINIPLEQMIDVPVFLRGNAHSFAELLYKMAL